MSYYELIAHFFHVSKRNETFIQTLNEMILYFYEHFMGDDILTRNNLPVAKMLTMMHAVNANGKRTH